MESYLEYHGEKLARRFDANTYIVLSEAMNHHDVGRGRGGIAAALSTVTGGDDDRRDLVGPPLPAAAPDELADLIPSALGVQVVESIHGHDGFLIETEAVGAIIRRAME